jgi:hypothetical protein
MKARLVTVAHGSTPVPTKGHRRLGCPTGYDTSEELQPLRRSRAERWCCIG